MTWENQWLTIGASVASGILLLIIIVIIVAACHRCRNKPKKRVEERERTEERAASISDNNSGPIELDEDDRYYSTIGLPAAEANNNTPTDGNCRPLPAVPGENADSSNALQVPAPAGNHSPYITRALKNVPRSRSPSPARNDLNLLFQ